MDFSSEDINEHYRSKEKAYIEAGFNEFQAEYIVDLQKQINDMQTQIDELRAIVRNLENTR